MRTWFIQAFVLISMVASSVAFSATDLSSLQASKSPLNIKQGVQRFSLAPTDVIIMNFSRNLIFASIPGTSIDMPVNSGYYGYLVSYDASLYFTLNIEDDMHVAYWSKTVCPRAIVQVFGPLSSDVFVETEHC